MLIGEIYLPLARLVTYYGEALDGIHLPFNFSLVTMGSWDAATIRRAGGRVRGGAAGGRLAELGARQPRHAARRDALGPGAPAWRRCCC